MLIKEGKTNLKYLLIVFVLAAIVGGGVLWCATKQEIPSTQLPTAKKECVNDDDCVVFGKTGDCNCGCYNKNNLPSGTGGECFCAAPTSCKCVNGKCEGVFEESLPEELSGKERACVDSGGTVSTSLCCKSTTDFPNLCLIGPCGCSPDNSHQVKICDCGPNKCFDGNECVNFEPEGETAKCEFDEMVFYFRSGCGWCQKVKDDGTISKIEELGVTVTQVDTKVGPVEHEFPGVPTFVINKEVYVGYRTFEQLNELLGCL